MKWVFITEAHSADHWKLCNNMKGHIIERLSEDKRVSGFPEHSHCSSCSWLTLKERLSVQCQPLWKQRCSSSVLPFEISQSAAQNFIQDFSIKDISCCISQLLLAQLTCWGRSTLSLSRQDCLHLFFPLEQRGSRV